MTALGLPGSTTWTKDNPAKVVMSGGSPTDNNAILVRKGQMEVIQPYIDSGVIKIVADSGLTTGMLPMPLQDDGEYPHRPAEQDRCSGCLE